MDRIILHCDLNGFFASVAELFYPQYKTVPMAVAGNPDNRHGIILAKNELAKGFGVKTATTIWQARQLCPELVLTKPMYNEYRHYSELVNKIYLDYTDLVEPFGIDESWLDVTGTAHLFGTGEQIAHRIRQDIKQRLGLTISVGVSYNKMYAKLGSDYKKPDAVTVFSRENYKQLVYPLPVEQLLFVGGKMAATLKTMHVTTIGDLAAADAKTLSIKLGKMAFELVAGAKGEDTSSVRPFDSPEDLKSVGNGTTFKRDLVGYDEIKSGIIMLCDTVASRLRKHGLYTRGVRIAVKLPNFTVTQKQCQLTKPTNTSKALSQAALMLAKRCVDDKTPVRALTVTAAPVLPDEELQLSMFDTDDEKTLALEKTMDGIRGRYGKSSIGFFNTPNEKK